MESLQQIPLTDIFVDYEWNGRSEYDVMADESDAVQDTTARGEHQALGTGLAGLRNTIAARGQDTSVVLRPVLGGKSLRGLVAHRPWELVAGFRRFTAIQQLHKDSVPIPGLVHGHIKVCVREMSPLEATLLNGRENTDRKNLSTPDMLFVAKRLSGFGLTQKVIGLELGVATTYITRLLRIARLPLGVLEHWRSGRPLPGMKPIVHKRVSSETLLKLVDEQDAGLLEHRVIERYIEIVENPPPNRHTRAHTQRTERAFHALSEIARVLTDDGITDAEKIAHIKIELGNLI